MSSPKVSIIMGVYNTPIKYVYTAIDSILNQTFTDFEFIICNDGCTDDTFKYIKKIYGKNKKIKLIENENNKGLAYTLNHCLKEAEGEYIARMDSDDYSHSDRIEKQVQILDNNKKIGLVNCNVNVFDETGIYNERRYSEVITKTNFLKNNPIIHPAVMFRKSEVMKVNGYRDIKKTLRNEDYDLFMRMFANGTKMCTIQEKIFDFREDKESYKRRKYRYRVNEFLIRIEGFKKLGLYPQGIIYIFKPLVIGLIPYSIQKKLRR